MVYNVTNLDDLCKALGDKKVIEIISKFECPKNLEVESFIKEKAILLSRQNISKTYIVSTNINESTIVVGYFAVANKMTRIKKGFFGGRSKKRFERFAETTIDENTYLSSLPLIGQLGKNFYNNYNNYISGDVLLRLACNKVKEIQSMIGGRFVFLECEDIPPIKKFYEDNGFQCYNKRKLDKYETVNSNKYLLQMICDLSNLH